MLGSYGLRPSTSMVTMAMSSAATAVMLDDESAQARTSLAHAKARAHWNWLDAELDFQRAIRLDPGYATGHHWYARCCLVPLGRLDEARDEVLLAHSLDPVSSIIAREVASIHYYRRDFEGALAHCDQAIELNPHFPHAYFILSLVQEKLGDFDEALAALLRGAQLAPKSPRMIASLGRAQAMAGRREDALRSLAELDELARTRFVSPWERAILFLGMKDHDAASSSCSSRCRIASSISRCSASIRASTTCATTPLRKTAARRRPHDNSGFLRLAAARQAREVLPRRRVPRIEGERPSNVRSASSRSPACASAPPRSLWAIAESGASSTAFRRCPIASATRPPANSSTPSSSCASAKSGFSASARERAHRI